MKHYESHWLPSVFNAIASGQMTAITSHGQEGVAPYEVGDVVEMIEVDYTGEVTGYRLTVLIRHVAQVTTTNDICSIEIISSVVPGIETSKPPEGIQ